MSEAGKGDRYRPVDRELYRANYDKIDWSDDGRGPDTAHHDRLRPASLYLPDDPTPYTGLGYARLERVNGPSVLDGLQVEAFAHVHVPFETARRLMDPLIEVHEIELLCPLYLPDGEIVRERWRAYLAHAGDIRKGGWWELEFRLASSDALDDAIQRFAGRVA